jgi:hypothetical protein
VMFERVHCGNIVSANQRPEIPSCNFAAFVFN